MRGSQTVGPGIATADDDNVLVPRGDARRRIDDVPQLPPILLLEELHDVIAGNFADIADLIVGQFRDVWSSGY